MIDNKIISRLQDLKFLGKIKGANVSIVSKKSEYHDTVKFYAQINVENRIQKISFEATGCTTFMAMCSYFCEMINGMKVSSALKVTQEDLEKIVKVKDCNNHVFPIILDTFKLLIAKYNKGLEIGKIKPAEVIEEQEKTIIIKSNKDKNIVVDKTLDKYLENTKKIINKKEKPLLKDIELTEDAEVIVEEKNIEPQENTNTKVKITQTKNRTTKKTSKENKDNANIVIAENKKANKKSTKTENKKANSLLKENDVEIILEEDSVNNEILPNVVVTQNEDNDNHSEIVTEEKQIVKVVETKEEVAVKHSEDSVEITTTKTTNEIHLGHLSSLQQKLKVKENHEKSQHNLHNLSDLLNKMSSHKENKSNDKVVIEKPIEKEGKPEKQGKFSLFSWFKKK